MSKPGGIPNSRKQERTEGRHLFLEHADPGFRRRGICAECGRIRIHQIHADLDELKLGIAQSLAVPMSMIDGRPWVATEQESS